MAVAAPAVNDDENADGGPADVVQQWRDELERAAKEMKGWEGDSKKIFERLRVKKKDGSSSATKANYSVLWSNIQTQAPALYAKPPKAVVGRRYLDKDPIARVASRILERAIQYMIDAGDLDRTVKQCVRDRLAIGRGVAWCRYEPTIEAMPSPEDIGSDAAGNDPETQQLEQLVWEMVEVDYVHWRDFRHDPARWWEEVSWVARRSYLNRRELVKRFGEEVGKAVTLNDDKDRIGDRETSEDSPKSKATVWEIWDKSARQVIWIAEDYDGVLDTRDDPHKLSEFFPCPRPLYGAMTNDSLVPTPDIDQYAGQAEIMDNTTARIAALVKACRVLGVYNNKFDVLARLFTEGNENELFPVNDWGAFSEREGLKGALDFVPIDIFAKVLEELAKVREATKAEINEISGISDILRGQGDAGETATGVQRKGQFATLRLSDEQGEVARFVRDIIRIMGEIACEQFDPTTLAQMASVQEMTELQIKVPAPMPAPPPPSPMLGHNGGPPMDPGPAPAAPGAMAPPPGGMPAGGAPMPPQHLPAMAGLAHG